MMGDEGKKQGSDKYYIHYFFFYEIQISSGFRNTK